jgi:TetR/AcrR family transcriptional regulator
MSNSLPARRIGRPPGADGDKTRLALLDAALRAFAARGFDGASIREIAGEVGVGHNLVRHYFGSKEDLWQAAVRHGLEPAAAHIVEVFDVDAARPLRPTLRAGLEVLLVETAVNTDAFRLFLVEALRGGPRFDQIYDDILEPISQAIAAYAQVTDELPSMVDLRVVGIFVFGAVFSPFVFEGLASRVGFAPPRRGEPLDAHVEQLIDMIVAGLTRVSS